MEKMGKRRLAYMVRRFHDGIYILLTVEGSGGLVHELERRLRVTEPVIKFITVRIDEEQKRLNKIKTIREAREDGAGSGHCSGGGSQRRDGSSHGVEKSTAIRRWFVGQSDPKLELQTQRPDGLTIEDEQRPNFKEHHG